MKNSSINTEWGISALSLVDSVHLLKTNPNKANLT